MIELIANPKSRQYHTFKNTVIGSNFPWAWIEKTVSADQPIPDGHEEFGFYCHSFLRRPGKDLNEKSFYSKEESPIVKEAHDLVVEILESNQVRFDLIFRIAVNCVHPTESNKYSPPHEDHNWPHSNLLIYLTDPYKGETVVEDKKFFGKEDDAIIFQGMHYHRPPISNRRIVLVATFI